MVFSVVVNGPGFNPRTREGATQQITIYPDGGMVSIHAPVRVRPTGEGLEGAGGSFNPRTREGATRIFRAVQFLEVGFQSTHP